MWGPFRLGAYKGIITFAGEVRSIPRVRNAEEDDVPFLHVEREELQSEHRWPHPSVGRAEDALLSRCVPLDRSDLGRAVGFAIFLDPEDDPAPSAVGHRSNVLRHLVLPGRLT